jgi:hypothetical protein
VENPEPTLAVSCCCNGRRAGARRLGSPSESSSIPRCEPYDKAAGCLAKHRVALLAFDFPAEHWKTRPKHESLENTFATVRLCPQDQRCLWRATTLALVFKLARSAERHWPD